ncbi:feruloyl-CoA synthase [Burkholderia ubonensis]|uniref:feruloyl-CoA synthase n=1 Tax=Burkholderia ubonensis TaxID=101571 RepID=UPI000BA7D836|nr:feruloyl-CoA synthase [Burkholderia ubonensis]PAK14507.1 feruloyl-CoA synthase [Burkholderia ubonensis]RQP91868.1 feruloyl-CoA synthase [Burkholderia ubonensis]
MSTEDFIDADSLAPPRTVKVDRGDGTFILRSPEPLKPYARCIGEWVERWAAETPDAIAFAERDPDGQWRRVSYRELRRLVGAIGQSLIDLDLPAEQPIVVLSDNAIDHALLMLATMHVGRTICSVSSAYCRVAKDFGRIHGILRSLSPALVYASDASVYGPPLASSGLRPVTVFSRGADKYPGALAFDHLTCTVERPAVMEAFDAIQPDDSAKYLLTSGSSGQPKLVINTHRMLCANQQMIAQVWHFLELEKPIAVDWLPWSHTFGSNHNMNMILRNGGTMVIDEGRPLPGQVEKSVRNLCEIQPTLYFNVPRGFDMILPLLEQDESSARDFFKRIRMVFYAGAALPQSTWERLDALARRVRGRPIWFTTAWGSTETAPVATNPHWWLERAGVVGLPLPGVELKFVPNGRKLEMRVRGVSVFPGYRNAPEKTAQAFDEEGFYCIGDAGFLVDENHPEKGIVFNGRVAEDFKLTSGTWVSVGTLRVKIVSALAPLAQDVVITGHDRAELGVLIFPSPQLKALPVEEVASKVGAALHALRSEGGGSSQCPSRALVLTEPPSIEAGEITDKGYINQRAVIDRRAADVETLYATPCDPRVIALS